LDNLAFTNDGGATWTLAKGLSGFRSVVAYVPGVKSALVAVGPSGADYSTDDGCTWTALDGPGFDTLSFVRKKAVAWGAGVRGSIGRLVFETAESSNRSAATRTLRRTDGLRDHRIRSEEGKSNYEHTS